MTWRELSQYVTEVIPALEARGKPKSLSQDVMDAERKRITKPRRNPLDHNGRPG